MRGVFDLLVFVAEDLYFHKEYKAAEPGFEPGRVRLTQRLTEASCFLQEAFQTFAITRLCDSATISVGSCLVNF